MSIDEYKDSNNTSYEDNAERSNGEESQNKKISSEDAYHPNVHANSTTPSQGRVYNLREGNWGRNCSHRFGHEAQFIEFTFNTYGFKRGLKEFKQSREESLDDELLNVHKRGTFHTKHPENMIYQENIKSWNLLCF